MKLGSSSNLANVGTVYYLAKVSSGRFVEHQLWVQALQLIL